MSTCWPSHRASLTGVGVDTIDVSSRVWAALLALRNGETVVTPADWSADEHRALDLYSPLATRQSRPVTVGQIGQSLDGRIAVVNDDDREVSGPDGLVHLHRIRALVDGVVIGVGTALHDSPRLTVRLCEGPQPARIVIDPRGRLPHDAPMLADDGARRIVIQASAIERPAGVEVIELPSDDGRLDPTVMLAHLHDLGLQHLLIEGGGFTLSRFIEAELLERLHIAIAPVIIGAGPQGLTLQKPPEELSEAIRPKTTAYSLGTDVVFDCALDSESAVE